MNEKNDVSKALGFLANSKLNINKEAILALSSGKNTIPKKVQFKNIKKVWRL